MINDEFGHYPEHSFNVINVNEESDIQHRQRDRYAVYVEGNKVDNNAKHRQEHGHAVYVSN